ncbi:MAG: hypothetical protein ACM3SV_05185 [Betaproteobacteria bacterium]
MATVICRRAFSRPELIRLAAFWVCLAAFALPAWAGISISIGSIEHPAVSATDMRLEIGDAKAVLDIARLAVPGREFKQIRGECGRLVWQRVGFECESGSLSAAGFKERLPLRFSWRSGVLEVNIEPAASERWQVKRSASGDIDLTINGGRVDRFQAILPAPAGWKSAGRLDGKVSLSPAMVEGRLQLSGGSFADQAGEHAAEKLAGEIRFSARRKGSAWDWESEAHWSEGEVYWQPFYAKADGQMLKTRGRLTSERFEIASAQAVLPGVGEVISSAVWERKANKLLSASLASPGLDLAKRGAAYLNPILAPHGVPEMKFGGRMSFSLYWDKEGLTTLALGLDDVSLSDMNGRFSASGIYGGLPWDRKSTQDGYLKVSGAKAGAFTLGAFELPLLVAPNRFSVNEAEIPFQGSKIVLDHLVWRKSTKRGAWEGDLSMSILPVALADLTQAFGLPAMSGTLSGSFPHLRYRDGAAFLDGALVIQVFEGYLNCTNLRLEDPFGTVPRLTADIDVQRINLGQMTEAFSFGNITGYADAEIKGLELAGWKPVKFDAKVMSSPGSYRKRISQRAVQNISSLGGAGAGAAVQATFLRFFEDFGYERIGLSCVLRGGVCEMGGVENAPNGYVMVKGGGIPALSVIGYNRRVDWTELVDRLKNIATSNVSPVIK